MLAGGFVPQGENPGGDVALDRVVVLAAGLLKFEEGVLFELLGVGLGTGVGEEGLAGEGGAEIEVGNAAIAGAAGGEIQREGVACFGQLGAVVTVKAGGKSGFDGLGSFGDAVDNTLFTRERIGLTGVDGEDALVGMEGCVDILAGLGGAAFRESGFDLRCID